MAEEKKDVQVAETEREHTSDNPSIERGENPFITKFSDKTIIALPSQVSARLDLDLNNISGSGGSIRQRHIDFTNGDATPSVKNANIFETAGATSITDFDDGIIGQVIHIKATASIKVTDNAAILLNESTDYDMADGDTLTLCMFDDQIWHEIGRAVTSAASGTEIQEFTGDGTWTKPTGALFVEVYCIGGGGGGGGGRRESAAVGDGGGGGAGGGYSVKSFQADALNATETVTVGAGGGGGTGAGAGVGDLDGSIGTAGGDTSFGTTTLLVAKGGSAGTAGVDGGGGTSSGGALANGEIKEAGGDGGAGEPAGTVPVSTATGMSPRGGGGGGEENTSSVAGAGFITYYVKAGGAGGGDGVDGTAGAVTDASLLYGGVGGGGGGQWADGGNGGTPGGGAGGGGGSGEDLQAAGDGGTGAAGLVVVVTYF